jgi:hypothetical protein
MLDFINKNTNHLLNFTNHNIDINLVNITVEKLKKDRLITVTGFK